MAAKQTKTEDQDTKVETADVVVKSDDAQEIGVKDTIIVRSGTVIETF